jgi:hypothetical protein
MGNLSTSTNTNTNTNTSISIASISSSGANPSMAATGPSGTVEMNRRSQPTNQHRKGFIQLPVVVEAASEQEAETSSDSDAISSDSFEYGRQG